MTLSYWPAMGGGRRSFDEVEPVLRSHAIGAATIDPRYDAREDWSLDALAAEVAATGADVYAGSSWGGAVAARAAVLRAPRALVLIDGGHIGPADFPGFGAKPTPEERLDDLRRQYVETMHWPTLDAYLAWAKEESPRWNETIEAIALDGAHEVDGEIRPRYDLATFEAILTGYEQYDPVATLSRLSEETRVLVLCAIGVPEIDDKRREIAVRAQELVPHADVRLLEGGHDLVWDLGPEVGEMVAEWLEA